jgi:tetratricopeptide (TPR) repeat protein
MTTFAAYTTCRNGTSSGSSLINRVVRLFAAIGMALALAVTATGCATQGHALARLSNGELSSAYQDMKDGRYGAAAAIYLLVLQEESGGPAAEESRFRLGQCYFHMRSYLDAGTQFQRYLSDYPNGAFAANSKQYVAELREMEEQERAQDEQREREIRIRIEHWRAVAKSEPDNAEAAVEIGHALWDLDEYEAAAREYIRGIELDPDVIYGKLLSQRISFNDDDTVTVLTPEEIAEFEKERTPIVVFNTYDYRGGDAGVLHAEPRWYIVTGQIVNRSSQTVRGVAVLVTIKDFAGHVLDSTEHRIGTVRPGQIRAFSVRFTSFKNIYDIDRYECEPVFE